MTGQDGERKIAKRGAVEDAIKTFIAQHPNENLSLTELQKGAVGFTRSQVSGGCRILVRDRVLTKVKGTGDYIYDPASNVDPQPFTLEDSQPELPLNGSQNGSQTVGEKIGTLDLWRDENGNLFVGIAANFPQR